MSQGQKPGTLAKFRIGEERLEKFKENQKEKCHRNPGLFNHSECIREAL